jgi:hypothetical protein
VIRKLAAQGKSVAYIAKKLGCSENYVYTVQWKAKSKKQKKYPLFKITEFVKADAPTSLPDLPATAKSGNGNGEAYFVANIADLMDYVDSYRDAEKALASIVKQLRDAAAPF